MKNESNTRSTIVYICTYPISQMGEKRNVIHQSEKSRKASVYVCARPDKKQIKTQLFLGYGKR